MEATTKLMATVEPERSAMSQHCVGTGARESTVMVYTPPPEDAMMRSGLEFALMAPAVVTVAVPITEMLLRARPRMYEYGSA
jgi:hypothetical protein